MFHNIGLPKHLVPMIPLTCICFGNLRGTLQRRMVRTLGFRPQQNTRMRPLQATLPMGFKWTVYIAHNFAKSCVTQAYSNFLSSDHQIMPRPCLKIFARKSGVIELSDGDVLVMHIIDYVNFICVGWAPDRVFRLHRECEAVFNANGLPIKRPKSATPGSVVTEQMIFIGWTWAFSGQVVSPVYLNSKIH